MKEIMVTTAVLISAYFIRHVINHKSLSSFFKFFTGIFSIFSALVILGPTLSPSSSDNIKQAPHSGAKKHNPNHYKGKPEKEAIENSSDIPETFRNLLLTHHSKSDELKQLG